MMKPQVSGLGFVCCLVQFRGCVPFACPKSRQCTTERGTKGSSLMVRQLFVSNGETHFL
jgi:hypothetical protein